MSRIGNYAQIRPLDIANGEGIRVSVFVTGCTHNCPGCFNALYQNFTYGTPWTDQTTAQLIEYLNHRAVSGLTLLGGEPMQNLWLTPIVQEVRRNLTTNIWVYSGYTFEEIIAHKGRKEILELCDVLVDGKYIEKIRDLRLKFRGSSNQRIIDIPASLASTKVEIIQKYHQPQVEKEPAQAIY